MFKSLIQLYKTFKASLTAKPLQIEFHRDITGGARHGSLYVSHPGLGIHEYPICFAFVDVEKVPALTAGLLSYIWSEAERKGYVVHCLRDYANIMQLPVKMKNATKLTTGTMHDMAPTARIYPIERPLEE